MKLDNNAYFCIDVRILTTLDFFIFLRRDENCSSMVFPNTGCGARRCLHADLRMRGKRSGMQEHSEKPLIISGIKGNYPVRLII